MRNFTAAIFSSAVAKLTLRPVAASVTIVTVLTFAFTASVTAQAKSLNHRLGVGYKNQFLADIPSLAGQYYASDNTAFNAALGIQSGSNASKFGLMARVNHVVFPEEHMNFYLGAGLGTYNTSVTTAGNSVSDSGVEIDGYVGSEFFLPGLDSLAFYFEAGIGVVSGSNGVIFRTFGQSPLQAGMLFYF